MPIAEIPGRLSAQLAFDARAPLANYNEPLRRQLFQQRLRLLQVARVEAFGKPPVNRSQEFVRLLHLALVAPEVCEAHGGPSRFSVFLKTLAGRATSWRGLLPL
jgi:hypothetical protein